MITEQRDERRKVLLAGSPEAYMKVSADHMKAKQMRVGKLN